MNNLPLEKIKILYRDKSLELYEELIDAMPILENPQRYDFDDVLFIMNEKRNRQPLKILAIQRMFAKESDTFDNIIASVVYHLRSYSISTYKSK